MDLFALGKIWFLEAGRLKSKVFVASLPPGWVESPDLAHLAHLLNLSITLYPTVVALCSIRQCLLHACWCLGPFTQVGLPMLSLACPLAKTGWVSCTRHVSKGGKGAARWPRWFMLCRVTQKLFQPPTNIIPTSYFVTRGQPSPWDTSAAICIWM